MSQQQYSQDNQWSSRWVFMLAAAGAAVGLGNIWKFPYITGENGGGAFVLFYLLCVLFLGIPIMVAEIIIGRRGRQNPADACAHLAQTSGRSPHWRWLGMMGIAAGFIILSYYCTIAGWACQYIIKAMSGDFVHASAHTIDTIFENLVKQPRVLLFWHTIIMSATVIVLVGGVRKGIERTIVFMFPTMLIFLLVMVGYAYHTSAFAQGVTFLFKPNFHKLTGNSMLIALGHSFFTLSLGQGSIMAYGAYLPKRVSIMESTFVIAAADTLVALLAGLAIFPIVFANHLTPSTGPSLIFKTLPIAFGQMPYGSFFAVLFFIMLVFAAFTTSIALLEPTVAWLMETFRMHRRTAAISAGLACWVLGLGTVMSFSDWHQFQIFGLDFFGIIDYLTANIMLPLGGLGVALLVGWLTKKTILQEEMAGCAGWLIYSWRYVLRYISPIAIIIVFLNALHLI
ncbi:MAG: sodium-dependent transporter [Gammaproteobacteria bacterium]